MRKAELRSLEVVVYRRAADGAWRWTIPRGTSWCSRAPAVLAVRWAVACQLRSAQN